MLAAAAGQAAGNAEAETSGSSPPPAGAVTTPAPYGGGMRRSPRAAGGAVVGPVEDTPPILAAGAADTEADEKGTWALGARRESPRLEAKARDTQSDVNAQMMQHAPNGAAEQRGAAQPKTARAARAEAAREIADLLADDESEFKLYASNPDGLREMVISAAEARDAGIPHGTANADEWGFGWARKFGEATGTRWMRPRAASSAFDAMRETYFAVCLLVWVAQMMSPSARRRAAGYGEAKPTSALLALYAFMRVMRDCGRYVPDMATARGVLKGVSMQYKSRWGDEAFVPDRKWPFTNAALLAMVRAIMTSPLLTWPNTLRLAMVTAFCCAMSTGIRKDEWTESFKGDTLMRRGNFTWVDENGRDLPSTPQVVRSRKRGHMLRGRSAASKCDRLNVEWGAKDMWFRYDESNPLNFAWRWQQWELQCPCPADERHRWPAFSPEGNWKPFDGKFADTLLRALLRCVMSEEDASHYSWHSARVTIATMLNKLRGKEIARDEIEGVIQALVRWKTPEAMRIYAKMDPQVYANYVDLATSGRDVSAPYTGAPPEVDPEHVFPEISGAAEAMTTEARAAAQTTSKKRAAERAPEETDGGRSRKARRPAPPTGGTAARAPAAEEPAEYDFGDGRSASSLGADSWGATALELRVHASFWGSTPREGTWRWSSDEYHDCVVAGYVGRYEFDDGKVSTYTYAIEHETYHYPMRHSAVADAIRDEATRRRLRRAPPPRVQRA